MRPAMEVPLNMLNMLNGAMARSAVAELRPLKTLCGIAKLRYCSLLKKNANHAFCHAGFDQ